MTFVYLPYHIDLNLSFGSLHFVPADDRLWGTISLVLLFIMITDSNDAFNNNFVKDQGTYSDPLKLIYFLFQQKKEGKDLEFRELVEMTIQHLVSEL